MACICLVCIYLSQRSVAITIVPKLASIDESTYHTIRVLIYLGFFLAIYFPIVLVFILFNFWKVRKSGKFGDYSKDEYIEFK
jgi:hypothetical protein